MSAMWPLLKTELIKVLPQLQALCKPLAVPATHASAATDFMRIQRELKSALSVLGPGPLAELLVWLESVLKKDPPSVDFQVWAPALRLALERIEAHVQRGIELSEVNALAAAEHALLDAENAPFGIGKLASQPPHLVAPETTAAVKVEPVDARLRALFAQEAAEKSQQIERILLSLEQNPDHLELIAPLMRAAHSLKGAARAVRLERVVKIAHALEDRFSAAQKSESSVPLGLIELGLQSLDAILALAQRDVGADEQADALHPQLAGFVASTLSVTPSARARSTAEPRETSSYIDVESADAVLRVRASAMGKIIDLAVNAVVMLERLQPFAQRQIQLRRQLGQMARALETQFQQTQASARDRVRHIEQRRDFAQMRQDINRWLEDFGEYSRESQALSERIYNASAGTRLRPFGDLVESYPRVVRDLAKQLSKKVQLVVQGNAVQVDRDVLEQLDTVLMHLLRNALDHGLESIERRRAALKPDEGLLTLKASYRAGLLAIDFADDGAGIDAETIRQSIVEKGLFSAAQAAAMDVAELYDCLFSSGFSTRQEVTEISGRGVGLDVVRQTIKRMDGSIKIQSQNGMGTSFHMLLPISRAVMRVLVVLVAGESYAFPLIRIDRLVRVAKQASNVDASHQFIEIGDKNISLLGLAEHLELGRSDTLLEQMSIVVLNHEGRRIGFLVDQFVGEFDLACKPLDARLGRVADIASAAILPNGEPVFILDVDDLMRAAGQRERASLLLAKDPSVSGHKTQRVLVVDDSISVRELERQLLLARGYDVEIAIDGLDAWNMLRSRNFDLVVTDVDMPRMDGIELTRSIKQDSRLRQVPVVIVSYRDRAEDRERGMEVRADAYLTKGDFQEDGFLNLVHDLIGAAHGS